MVRGPRWVVSETRRELRLLERKPSSRPVWLFCPSVVRVLLSAAQAEAPALQLLLLLLLPHPSRSPRLLRVGREPWFKSVGARSGQRNKRAGTIIAHRCHWSGSGRWCPGRVRVVSFHPPKRPRPALSSSVSSVGEGGVSAGSEDQMPTADTIADGHFCLG